MPDLVRGCFQQVKSTNDNVILVTQENIRQYSDIPITFFVGLSKVKLALLILVIYFV